MDEKLNNLPASDNNSAVASEATVPMNPVTQSDANAPQTKSILMCEDDMYVRDLYSRKLIQTGFNVTTASDGAEGLQSALDGNFDLILLDIMMPKLTGIEVLRKLKENSKTKDTPVFLMTNLGQEGIIKEAFKMGVKGYFLKTRMLPLDVANHIQTFFTSGEVPAESKRI
jgi:CheY-like chemotaxis protein